MKFDDLVYKILNEDGLSLNTNENSPRVKTFGDLSKIIQSISLKRTGKAVADQAVDFALTQALGLVPGGSNIKTAFDFLKAVSKKPDTKKTNSVLDKLDIDDDISKIVDDTVETAFLQHVQELLSKHSPTEAIPNDWNMTKELIEFIKKTYHGRSLQLPS